eukprot:509722_1
MLLHHGRLISLTELQGIHDIKIQRTRNHQYHQIRMKKIIQWINLTNRNSITILNKSLSQRKRILRKNKPPTNMLENINNNNINIPLTNTIIPTTTTTNNNNISIPP